jgi:hypothetical protein
MALRPSFIARLRSEHHDYRHVMLMFCLCFGGQRIGKMAPVWPGYHLCSVAIAWALEAGAAAVNIMLRDTGIPADYAGLLVEGHPLSPRSLLT